MKKMLLVFLLGLVLVLIFQIAYSTYYFSIANKLSKTGYARKTLIGDSSKPLFRLFIAGDSVGAGVGASSFETSVAGKLGNYFAGDHQVEFENTSVSGHKVKDLLNGQSPAEQQDLIILIASSNNLFRLTNLDQFEKDVNDLFTKYSPKAKQVLLIGPGRIFDSTAIPLVVRPVYRFQGRKYAEVLKSESVKFGNVVYVNPFEYTPSEKRYGDTLASDKFHPGDRGHEFWFDMIIEGLERKTPGG